MRVPRLGTLVFAAGLVASLAGSAPTRAAEGPVLVHPPDLALLDSGNVEALGFRPEGSPPISLQVAGPGRPGESVAVPAGVFRISLSLSPGESVITLGGRSVKVFVTGPGAQAPEAFSPPDPHSVDNGCEECHAAARDAMPLNAAMPQLCENCHDPIGKGKDGESISTRRTRLSPAPPNRGWCRSRRSAPSEDNCSMSC